MATVLIADDEKAICDAFSDLLTADGHNAITAGNGDDALRLVETEHPDVVFLDIRMPGRDGLDVLKDLSQRHPHLPVILMTAYGTVETAVQAMHYKAFDYLGKPVELARIRKTLARALHVAGELANASTTTDKTTQASDHDSHSRELVGHSAEMQEIFKLIGLLTSNDLTVLVTGESGVGKELVARAIHDHGSRKSHPFVAVNCAAIPATLLESELFGHVKGAFTDARRDHVGRLEAAGSGTIFLDEIAEMPLTIQSKLLRVLQEKSFEPVGSNDSRPVHARIVAASNRNLKNESSQGTIRDDLYHRLNMVHIEIPPLRNRKTDIPDLTGHFLERANREIGKSITGVDDEVLKRFETYSWPGNVRELEHCIHRAVLTSPGPTLSIHDFDLGSDASPDQVDHPDNSANTSDTGTVLRGRLRQLLETGTGDSPYSDIVAAVERELVHIALDACDGNQVAAAKMLGINRTTLRRRLTS